MVPGRRRWTCWPQQSKPPPCYCVVKETHAPDNDVVLFVWFQNRVVPFRVLRFILFLPVSSAAAPEVLELNSPVVVIW